MTFEIAIPDWEMKTYIQIISVLYVILCWNVVYGNSKKYYDLINYNPSCEEEDDCICCKFVNLLVMAVSPVVYSFFISSFVIQRTVFLPGFIYSKFNQGT